MNGQQLLERFAFVMRTVADGHLFFNLMRPLIYREVLLDLGSQETKRGQYEFVCQCVETFKPRRRGLLNYQAE